MNLSYRSYLSPIIIMAVVSWTAFAIVINKMLPPLDGATNVGLILFLISLFFAMGSSFIVLVCLSRRIVLGQTQIANSEFNAAIRQGFLLSILAVGSLGLLRFHTLNWWSGLLFVAAIVLAEYYFSSLSR